MSISLFRASFWNGSLWNCEWRVLRRDRVFWGALLLWIMLIWFGVSNGALQVQRNKRVLLLAAAELQKQKQENKDFFTFVDSQPNAGVLPWNAGIVAQQLWPRHFLPPSPLATSAIGQSDVWPMGVQIRTQFDWVLAGEEIENPLNSLTGRFDLAFVVVYLLPLLILGLCYDVLARERENRTLSLILSQPVALSSLLRIKIGVRALPILGVTIGATALFLSLSGVPLFTGEGFFRWASWMSVTLLYGAFWLTLAALVNARGLNSASAAATLAGCWLGIVLILPSLIAGVATTFFPAPPRLALTQAVHRADEAAMAHGSMLLEDFYRHRPDWKPKGKAELNDYWTQRYAMNRHIEHELSPLLQQVESAQQRQERWNRWAALFSPALLTQGALWDIAGNSDERYYEFARQIDEFRSQWRAFFEPRIFRQSGLPLSQWKKVPQFTFHEESTLTLTTRWALPCLALFLLSLILGLMSRKSLLSYRIAG